MPFSHTIENIQDSTKELNESRRRYRADQRAMALEYADTANAAESLELINMLIGTVSSITGEAGDLEDAACVLIKHIENEGE